MNYFPTAYVIGAAKVGLFLSLLGVLIAISQSSLMTADDFIPTALAIDLIFSLPITYFFLIRKTSVPKITIVPVFFASFLIASWVLPERLAFMSFAGLVVIPAVELGGLAYLAYRIYRTRKAYRRGIDADSDLMERLSSALEHEIKPPAIARAAAFELGIFAYAFIKWRRKPVGENVFTYHRTTSPHLIVGVFLFLITVETIGMHLLIALWSETFAWIATALSIYFAIQLLAHLKAMILRPSVVSDERLYLRCGILGDALIQRKNVLSAEVTSEAGESALDLLPLGAMSQPNVRLTLREPVAVYGFYGLRTHSRVLRLSLDDPEDFAAAIK
jgi:hypothetical protein